MAMEARQPAFNAGRLEEIQRENEELREQLRRYQAAQAVARGAILEATHEKDATARIAHQVAVEERATRTAVEVQAQNLNYSLILQVIHLLLLVVVAIGLFGWLPRELESRVPQTVVAPSAGAPIVVPNR
jgi:hypothetical protein